MTHTKEEILKLMKGLPKIMIEEYETANFLPCEPQTIEKLILSFNKNYGLSITSDMIGYTKEVSNKIDFLYNELRTN